MDARISMEGNTLREPIDQDIKLITGCQFGPIT
jgi:hypothetical protein